MAVGRTSIDVDLRLVVPEPIVAALTAMGWTPPSGTPAIGGVWMVVYSDGSGAYPFPDEVTALRWADNNGGGPVVHVPWGQNARTAR